MADHPAASAVREVPCLAGFTPDEAAAVAAQVTLVALAPGEALFHQGDPGGSVYVLVSGNVEIRVGGTNGEHEIATIGPGTLIGEFALLVDEQRTRSVVGCSQAQLWELPRTAFEAGLAAGESWATSFLMAVARELANQMLAVDRLLVGLMDQGTHHDEPSARVRELEKLRRQLSGEWSF
jgi:CRP/FNR family cyclic AMP-dependent transcriptional regulator